MTEPEQGSGDGRADAIARTAATLLNVSQYRLVILDEIDGDSRAGAAYAAPAIGRIEVTTASLSLSDDELLALLCHEIAHLRLRPPRILEWRASLRWLSVCVGAGIIGMVAGWQYPASLTERVAIGLLSALVTWICLAVATQLLLAWFERRYELACEVEQAHACGTRGLGLLDRDPIRNCSWWEIVYGSHPTPEQRRRVIAQHDLRRTCGCVPERRNPRRPG
jgi:hypothetical protein